MTNCQNSEISTLICAVKGGVKRKALKKNSHGVISEKMPAWQDDKELMIWLKNLGK